MKRQGMAVLLVALLVGPPLIQIHAPAYACSGGGCAGHACSVTWDCRTTAMCAYTQYVPIAPGVFLCFELCDDTGNGNCFGSDMGPPTCKIKCNGMVCNRPGACSCAVSLCFCSY